jgi:hypothetical protein
VKKSRFSAAYLVGVALLALVALSFLKRHLRAEESAGSTSVVPVVGPPPSQVFAAPVPLAVAEDRGHLEMVRAPPTALLPATIVEPLFEPDARVKIGEKAKLRFAARDRASGTPESLDRLSASVFRGNDPELRLPVKEVENGVYEVGFTPHGPGQFNVVLNQNGVAVGSQKVGAVGVAGAAAGVDPGGDPLSVDPRVYRARTAGRGRRR